MLKITEKLLLLILIQNQINSKLSERLWDTFFPEPHKRGLVKIQGKDEIFFWLFPSRSEPDNDPLVIWLTGGPGCSSELAIFVENGPLKLEKGNAAKRKYSWNNKANLLFVDQPIGTGYSRGDKKHLPKDQFKNREQFGIFLQKFYEKYPEFKNKPLYITGESYAGHYIPHIAEHYILNKKKFNEKGIQLQGIAIGNGWINPQIQNAAYPTYSYDNKLVNLVEKVMLDAGYFVCNFFIKFKLPYQEKICDSLNNYILKNKDGNLRFNIYDIRKPCDHPLCYDFSEMHKYFNRMDVQMELGVPGRKWETCSSQVYQAMAEDITSDCSDQMATVLNYGMKVLIYNGDKDWICNWVGTENLLENQAWKGQWFYQLQSWKEFDWGKSKSYGNLEYKVIYDAGHMVPMDQPKLSVEMLNNFMKK